MKSKSFVDVEVGVDRVQKFDLDDGGEGKACCGASGGLWLACGLL